MKITTIDLAKGENFSNCIWREATAKEQKKALNIIAMVKSKRKESKQ